MEHTLPGAAYPVATHAASFAEDDPPAHRSGLIEVVAAALILALLAALAVITVRSSSVGSHRLASAQMARDAKLFHQVTPAVAHLHAHSFALLSWGVLILLWAVYLATIWWLRTRPVHLRIAVWGAFAFCAVALLAPPVYSSDIFSYAMFGRLSTIYDANPYVTTPLGRAPADPLMSYVTWGNITSPYGPVWAMLSAAVAVGHHASPVVLVLRFKLLSLAATLFDGWLIYHLVRQRWRGWAPWAYLAFAWNPLVIVDGVINGHNDVVILAFALGGAWVLRRRPALSVALLVLSALIKYSTVPMLAGAVMQYWRRSSGWLRLLQIAGCAVLAALIAIATFHPFWAGPATLLSTFREPGRGANNPLSQLATWGAAELFAERVHLASSAVAIGLASVVFGGWQWAQMWWEGRAHRAWTVDDELGSWARTVLVFLLVWPRVHTWYWLLPLGLALAAGPRYRRLTALVMITSILGYFSLAR